MFSKCEKNIRKVPIMRNKILLKGTKKRSYKKCIMFNMEIIQNKANYPIITIDITPYII